ncbi:hypothetical protein DFJ58DRAFT_714463 [Suillus subalutaceus]|uniref:uncharacterized protein n=1 Tax=Suillus subalutaceus TaxID=48586 RepID=UPI001B86E3E1|nr:uncharacterized protein DFJ58DRAFT_714463 [Suillus subalutaceus]KAG1867264.1 hypothetical protein DFJ58DRAFT_714463 [Suillus subalutaceus]
MSHHACRDHSAHQIPCGYLHCECHSKTQAGCTKHWNALHPTFTSAPTTSVSYSATVEDEPEEPHDNFFAGDNFPAGSFDAGRPCDATGQFLADGAPPIPPPSKLPDDWTPYRNRVEFETAEFLYTRNQMSVGNINILLDLWAATLLKHNDKPPFADSRDLYKTIDSTLVGDVKWQSFNVRYTGEKPAHNVPPWMTESHDVWYRDPHDIIRNMLANPDYEKEMDYRPYREFSTDDNEHQWQDFMSGDWAWNQADIISKDSDTAGSTFVPVILGSDKMTVSVATGANDYYPLYVSIGNVSNNVRRAHRDAVAIIGFLAMPKTTKEHVACPKYRKYRRQLFHSSISKILENLRPGMMKPEVIMRSRFLACIVRSWCPRCMSHRKNLDTKSLYRNRDHAEALIEEVTSSDLWDEYGIVADLVPFTNDFPRGSIHELIAPDVLHQLIKGTFKDHLVEWVGQYLHHVYGKKGAEKIKDDIDRRIAVVASFSGLQHFPQALMKVYLPAIEGYVPMDVVRTFRAFLKFCYFVWRNIITESTLVQIQDALNRFHHYRKIFESTGVVFTFSLPRQHSCSHYALLTKHIKAVKEPWRRSSRYQALGQMLVTNQHLDKLAASCIDFKSRGMLNGTYPDVTTQGDNEEGEIIDGPMLVQAHVHTELSTPRLYNLLRRFLFEQLHPDYEPSPSDILLASCPRFDGKIQVFNSASSTFYAPSDRSGIDGMRREHIRACPLWRNEAPQYDCVFVNTNAAVEGMGGMDIGRVMCFFSFTFEAVSYPCAVVCWFEKASDGPDEDTGMWIVKPSYDTDHSPLIGIIHINSIYQAAHLIPIYGTHPIPENLKHYDSYDAFRASM